MTLTLPYPPSTNNAYATVRGRRVKSKAARQYGASVQAECLRQGASQRAAGWTGDTRLKVEVIVHPPDRRRRDLANVEKLPVDSVFEWLGLDDSQIDELRLVRDEVQTGGLLIVSIEATLKAPVGRVLS